MKFFVFFIALSLFLLGCSVHVQIDVVVLWLVFFLLSAMPYQYI